MQNCKAMGEVKAYGRVPFQEYDSMYVDDAIKKHVSNANALKSRTETVVTAVNGQNVTMEVDDRNEDED